MISSNMRLIWLAVFLAVRFALAEDLAILKPTTEQPNALGSPTVPSKSLVETTKPAADLGAGDFAVLVGGEPATVTAVYEAASNYYVQILPSALPEGDGTYDVQVDAASQSDSVVGGCASFSYPPVAVVVVIDRSSSMAGRVQRTAAAAAQFLDRLSDGDMAGVVTFNDPEHYEGTTLEYPLTLLEESAATVYYADDMESGTGVWRRLYSSGNPIPHSEPYWKLVSPVSHSADTAWCIYPWNDYAGLDKRLASTSFGLAGMTAPFLSFWYRLDKAPGDTPQASLDWRVRMSRDGGASWEHHPVYLEPLEPVRYQLETEGIWKWAIMSLADYVGLSQVQLEFRPWAGGLSISGRNLWIDDVAIVEGLTSMDFAKASLYTLDPAHGETSIGAGMQMARSMLTGAPKGFSRVMVMLTDGEENTEPYVSSVLPSVITANITVTGIGMGGLPASLRGAASATHGMFYQIDFANEADSTYARIADELTGQDVVAEISDSVAAGDGRDYILNLDATVSEATFTTFWYDHKGEVVFELESPSGTTIDEDYADTHADVEFKNLEEHGYARVEYPEEGEWILRLSTVVVPAATTGVETGLNGVDDIEYMLRLTTRSNLGIELLTSKEEYQDGEPIEIAAMVSDTQPILGATATVAVAYYPDIASSDPPAWTTNLELMDDDSNGVYTAVLAGGNVIGGTYELALSVSGESNGSSPVPFSRTATKFVTVPASLRITDIAVDSSAGNMVVTWDPSQTAATIESCTDLVLTNWAPVAGPLAGQGWTGTVATPPVSYYRVTTPEP